MVGEKPAAAEDKRTRYMDYLNVVACFAVVMLHCSLDIYQPSYEPRWLAALLIQCMFIFAVPVFIMLSGANLLGYRKRYTTGEFFKKRLKRILIPLVVGSVVYYAAGCLLTDYFPGIPKFEFSVGDFVRRFLTNDIHTNFWFFYTILMLYVMTPILSKIADDRKLMQYAIVIGILVAFGLPCLYDFVPDASTYIGHFTALPMFTADLVYFLLGYYLAKHMRWKANGFLLVAIGIVAILAMFFYTWQVNTPRAESFIGGFCIAWSLPCMVLACCVFLFFKNRDGFFKRHMGVSKAFQNMSAASMWVYVFHALLIYCLFPVFEGSALMHFVLRPLFVFVVMELAVTGVQGIWRHVRRRR